MRHWPQERHGPARCHRRDLCGGCGDGHDGLRGRANWWGRVCTAVGGALPTVRSEESLIIRGPWVPLPRLVTVSTEQKHRLEEPS